MKQLAIMLSSNEQRLYHKIYPVGYDVRQLDNDLESIKLTANFPQLVTYGIKPAPFIHKAIEASSYVVVQPDTFKRRTDARDSNLPNLGVRKTIPLTDDEWATIMKVKDKYFINSTVSTTVIWMMYNYSAMLSQDDTILTRVKRPTPSLMNDSNSHTVTIRLPREQYNYVATQATGDGVTVGRWLRDALTDVWPMIQSKQRTTTNGTTTNDFDMEEFE